MYDKLPTLIFVNMWYVTAIFSVVLITAVSCDNRGEIRFFLSTENQNRTELNYENLNVVDVKNPTVVLIHGFTVSSNQSWIIDLTAELLEEGGCNVIAVDYTPISHRVAYTVSDAKFVGEYTGELIANLYINYSANLSNFHVIGHSLGGQIAGFVGKTVQNLTGLNIGRITGLDPANPLFLPSNPEGRLTNTDADLVVALHTDGLVFGYYYQIGGIDFYANGGRAPQPGCLLGDLVLPRCSHVRATEYYVEAVRNRDGFVATECGDYLIYELGSCSENNKVTLGGNFAQSAFGKYYFKTNLESPYSQE